jgi:hypothetical protein
MAWDDDLRARFPDWGTEAALARWPGNRARLAVGQVARGVVIARAPFGVWVDIGAGHPALLLVPEMAGARERRIGFDDYPPLGATLDARIVALGERAEIGLSQHAVPTHGWLTSLLFLAGGIGFVAGYLLNITFISPAVPFDIRYMAFFFVIGALFGALWGSLVSWITGRPKLAILISGLLMMAAGITMLWLSAE